MDNKFDKQLRFLIETDKLKFVERKTRLFNSDRHENDAEHSWHLALMAIVLAEYAERDFDLLKVISMLLVHDLAEIYAGDTFLFDQNKNHDNNENEAIAAEKLFGLLPDGQNEQFLRLWQEFEAGKTPEACFARALDRFAPVLQNTINLGGTWKEYRINHTTLINKLKPVKEGSQKLWEYTLAQIRDLLNKGIIEC